MVKEQVAIKLEQLAQCVLDKLKDSIVFHRLGLYDGGFGILLFLFYYAKYKNDSEVNAILDRYVDCLLNELSAKIPSHTYGTGLSGILYLITFLNEKQLTHIDISDAEKSIEPFLEKALEKEFINNNYDFIHGAIGVGLYFLKKNKQEYVNRVIDYLDNTAQREGIITKWECSYFYEQPIYNISLSHGISSIIIFLSQVFEKYNSEKAKSMTEGAVNYILSQEMDFSKYGSLYPSFSTEAGLAKSRLGWCYGDLGIGIALWRASALLNVESWEKKAMDIFHRSATRKNDETVKDSSLCHGTAGISMIYNRLFLNTGERAFKEIADYWIWKTLRYAVFPDGLAGYKAAEKEGWVNSYCLLNGISGIGITLLSYLQDDNQDWDELFILS